MMRVRDLLQRKSSRVVTVEPSTDLGTAVNLLMQHGVDGLPVVAHGTTPVGFLSEREVVRAVHEYDGPIRHIRVEVLMRPVPLCSADDSIPDVLSRMSTNRLRHVVVHDEGRVAGIISTEDIARHRLEQQETELGVPRDHVAAHRATH
jgi:CBS domain-containing protein